MTGVLLLSSPRELLEPDAGVGAEAEPELPAELVGAGVGDADPEAGAAVGAVCSGAWVDPDCAPPDAAGAVGVGPEADPLVVVPAPPADGDGVAATGEEVDAGSVLPGLGGAAGTDGAGVAGADARLPDPPEAACGEFWRLTLSAIVTCAGRPEATSMVWARDVLPPYNALTTYLPGGTDTRKKPRLSVRPAQPRGP